MGKNQTVSVISGRSTMDNFKAVYKILATLEKAMDYEEFDVSQINHEAIGVSKERWTRYIEMMEDVGYIKGARVYKDLGGQKVELSDIKITLKGLEYLQENSLMRKAYNVVKGIKETVPMI